MIKYGTCDECSAVCETLHENALGQWVCSRHDATDGEKLRGYVLALRAGQSI